MKSKGIRIEDTKNQFQCIDLIEILNEIKTEKPPYWAILFLWGMGNLGENISIADFQQQIKESQNGVMLSWNELYDLAKKLEQIIDITIIGGSDLKLMQRYDTEEEMYNTCDIVIEIVDGFCWEVFAKDEDLINRLAAKFKNVQLLDVDLLNR